MERECWMCENFIEPKIGNAGRCKAAEEYLQIGCIATTPEGGRSMFVSVRGTARACEKHFVMSDESESEFKAYEAMRRDLAQHNGVQPGVDFPKTL